VFAMSWLGVGTFEWSAHVWGVNAVLSERATAQGTGLQYWTVGTFFLKGCLGRGHGDLKKHVNAKTTCACQDLAASLLIGKCRGFTR